MNIPRSGRVEVLLRIALAVMTLISIFAFVQSASAAGNTQISGMGQFDVDGDCDTAAYGADFALVLEGDLEGCLYTWVETSECRPSGTYMETGRETFVGTMNGEYGTFDTNFRFSAKFDNCPGFEGQIFGRCQHPVAAGSGTGVFEGLEGRLDFQDDVEAGIVYYRGHLG